MTILDNDIYDGSCINIIYPATSPAGQSSCFKIQYLPCGQSWDLSLLVLMQKSCSIPEDILSQKK